MNDHNLDDLIIDTNQPKNSKSKSLLTIVALLIVVFIVGIILARLNLEESGSNNAIIEENESEKTFGFKETFIDGGSPKSKERKMTADEFKAFKQFKKLYKKDVTI